MTDRTLRNALTAAVATVAGTTVVALAGWSFLEFDPALFTYAQALIISLGLTVYRFTIWAHRPPTKVLYARTWQLLKSSRNRFGLAKHLVLRITNYFALNRFVWKRGLTRWGAHWPIMIGCVMAMAIVVPLIFGWVWFETPPDDFHSYHVMVFGIHARTVAVDGLEAFLAFHGLVWASFPVVIGCGVALKRRLQDRGDAAVQTAANDLFPLVALLLIAITGLLMTISYSFLGGTLHAPLATIHMWLVCGTLLWLPFSKLFHIPQRTLKLAHMIYEYESTATGRIACSECGDEFADRQQIEDLIEVQRQLGYRYDINNGVEHYQFICPRCRRTALVRAQGSHWRQAALAAVPLPPEELAVGQ